MLLFGGNEVAILFCNAVTGSASLSHIAKFEQNDNRMTAE
jgi:hypothetical protein